VPEEYAAMSVENQPEDFEDDIVEDDELVIIPGAAHSLQISCAPEQGGARLDKFLADHGGDLSRSRLKALILEGAVSIGGKACTNPSLKLKGGEEILVEVPAAVDDRPVPQDIPLEIVYEDAALLVLNKPAGLVVHPGAGHHDGTLVNALLHHCAESLSGIGGVRRPGIVHRLDKDTSGLMLVAKTDAAHHHLSAQLADRSLTRKYYALVWKAPRVGKGSVDKPVGRHAHNRQKMAVGQRGSRSAVTHYKVLEKFGAALALLECALESGRTHQIRVHMEAIGHPLYGDPLYGIQATGARALLRKEGFEPEAIDELLAFPRQALHAFHIMFIHPESGEEMSFTAPPPPDFSALLTRLKAGAV